MAVADPLARELCKEGLAYTVTSYGVSLYPEHMEASIRWKSAMGIITLLPVVR